VTPDQQLALLRRFEPVIRYTRGEMFLPASVADYVAGSELVVADGERREVLAPRGSLNLEKLAELGRKHVGGRLSLERVERPFGRAEYREWRRRPDRTRFTPVSRFAVVGLLARLVDAGLRLTLLLRGRIPGGFTAAAQQAYAAAPDRDTCCYYGHVTTDAGYVVVQYWYFYAMNDWRSSFGGVNDHEADWEQVTIFLADDGSGGDLRLAWVAFSSHDEVGDDLRRRSDDPDIEWVGEHPVVYAGAGSHSGAYLPGEYVVTVAPPLPGWLARLRRLWIRLWPWRNEDDSSGFGIPYIDYRRGDGPTVGPGGERPWTPILVDDTTAWLRDYRGLWGLDTRDPLGGERAPAGPRYERNGSVRDSWGQPVSWAGLDKQPPTATAARACRSSSWSCCAASWPTSSANSSIGASGCGHPLPPGTSVVGRRVTRAPWCMNCKPTLPCCGPGSGSFPASSRISRSPSTVLRSQRRCTPISATGRCRSTAQRDPTGGCCACGPRRRRRCCSPSWVCCCCSTPSRR
jgi:hypothetical protein